MKNIFISIFIALMSILAPAEFRPNNLRYLSVYDFHTKMNTLLRLVLDDPQSANAKNYCFSNVNSLGFNNPTSGEPQSANPNSVTVRNVKTCIATVLMSANTILKSPDTPSSKSLEIVKALLPEALMTKYMINSTVWFTDIPTSQLSAEEQKLIVFDLTEKMLGIDQVVMSYGFITDVDAFRDYLYLQIKGNESVLQTVSRLMQILVLRDEYLTY